MSQSSEQKNKTVISGAITYPKPEPNENVKVSEEQPKQPTSIQGLLKFAMEATKAEDAPHESHLGPLDENVGKLFKKTSRRNYHYLF